LMKSIYFRILKAISDKVFSMPLFVFLIIFSIIFTLLFFVFLIMFLTFLLYTFFTCIREPIFHLNVSIKIIWCGWFFLSTFITFFHFLIVIDKFLLLVFCFFLFSIFFITIFTSIRQPISTFPLFTEIFWCGWFFHLTFITFFHN